MIKNNFEYPFDSKNILRKKSYLKKHLLQNNKNFKQIKIAILGGSTTSNIKDILELFLLNSKIKPFFYESGYNMFYEDAIFGNEKLKNFNPDIIYIHTSIVNIKKFPKISDTHLEVQNLINEEINKYKQIWNALNELNCSIIQNNFELPLDRSLGNLDFYDYRGKISFINNLNLQFARSADEIKNLFINDINYLSSLIGLENWFDRTLWYKAKYFLSMDSMPQLVNNISKIIFSLLGKSKKCLVLDLDNTCWGGVIGDDGLDGIKLGYESSIGEAYFDFQKYLLELKNRGVTLTISSKNDLKNVKEGLSHPDSILKFDDFVNIKANWEPKNNNIQEIANEINMDLSSLVFIDDNPSERDLIENQLPSISVPSIGPDVVNYIDHIDKNNFFEPLSLSKEDINRTDYYITDKKRLNESFKYNSYKDFLVSLDMSATILTFDDFHQKRILQLINKTNQFNLTTTRLNANGLNEIYKDHNFIKIYGRLIDKFGDNGLVSVIVGRIEKKICYIYIFLMSCRVINREMEYAMFDEFVTHCKIKKIKTIIGNYIKSNKNDLVKNLYKDLGFKLTERNGQDTSWILDIATYSKFNFSMKIINE